MSKLVKEYDELSYRLGDEDITETEEKDVVKRMDELEKQFSKEDWQELIKSVPAYMRPMIIKQMKKYIND